MTRHALMELADLLKEALPFVDTNPDLHRPGGDELSERIANKLNELRTAAAEGGEAYCWAVGSYIFRHKDHADQAVRSCWKEKDWAKGPLPLYLHPPTDSGAGRDGERYRWLRKQQWSDAQIFVVVGGKSRVKLGTNCPSYKLLDAAIDTAIAGAAGEPK